MQICLDSFRHTEQESGFKAQVYWGKEDKKINKNPHRMTNRRFGQEVCLSSTALVTFCSPYLSLFPPLPFTLMLGSSLRRTKRCSADTMHLQLLWKGEQTSQYSQNVFIKGSAPDSVLCSIFSVGVCVWDISPPFPFMGWILKCVLTLILCVRLGVVQACSRHDSHCGIRSLCLWNKAASVV